jgi:N-acetylneuraminic acid mutarotase
VIDGRIHVVAGSVSGAVNVDAHEIFDPASGTWQAGAPIPTPRDHLGVVAIDGRLLALGGRVDGDPAFNLDTVEIYDPSTDSWSTGAPMPTARSGVAVTVLDGKAYVMGGETRQVTFDAAEAYDPAADEWQALAPLPTARHGFGAVTHDGAIVTLMGSPSAGGDRSVIVERFEPAPKP